MEKFSNLSLGAILQAFEIILNYLSDERADKQAVMFELIDKD